MKKSDMIKVIVESIELHNGNDPGWLDFPEMSKQRRNAYEVAEKLLYDIEEAGMKPPPGKGTEYSDGGYIRLWTVDWDEED